MSDEMVPPVPAIFVTQVRWWVEQGVVRMVFGVPAPGDQPGAVAWQTAVALPVETALSICQNLPATIKENHDKAAAAVKKAN